MDISANAVVDDMKQQLGVTDEQAAKILPVIQSQVSSMKEILNKMSSGSEVSQDDIDSIQELSQKTDNEMAKILTPEQMAKWQAAIKEGQVKAQEMMSRQE